MLTINRPTATTSLYTVTTSPPLTTLTARLSSFATILLRLLTGTLILALLAHEYHHHSTPTNPPTFPLTRTPLSHLPPPYRLLLPPLLLYLLLLRPSTTESLLVIRGLGVQTSTSSRNYLWPSTTRFIPTTKIQDVFIYEAFKGFEVKYYLAIVVQGEGGVVVVFPSILPRREILEEVWRGTRACLYEPKG